MHQSHKVIQTSSSSPHHQLHHRLFTVHFSFAGQSSRLRESAYWKWIWIHKALLWIQIHTWREKKALSFSETLGAICWLSSRIAGLSLAKSKTSPNINSVCMCVLVCFCLCPILAPDGNQVRTQSEGGCLLFQWMLLSEQKTKRVKTDWQWEKKKISCTNIAVLC